MVLYYKNIQVDKVREYVYANTLMAEISVNGETKYVSRSELEEKTVDEIFNDKHEEVVECEACSIANANIDKQGSIVNEFKKIVVTKVGEEKGKELKTKESYEKFLTTNKLSEEAVEKVLSGEQKTHKGFTFEYK